MMIHCISFTHSIGSEIIIKLACLYRYHRVKELMKVAKVLNMLDSVYLFQYTFGDSEMKFIKYLL